MLEIHQIALELLPDEYAVCKLSPEASMPGWADGAGFVTITRSRHELSVVCRADRVPAGVEHEAEWKCLRFMGPFPLGVTGIVLSVVRPLSEGGVGVFVVSSYDGDYLLIKKHDVAWSTALLQRAGHSIRAATQT